MKRLIATIALALLVVPATFAGEQSLAVDSGPAVRNRKAARISGRTIYERNAVVIDRFFETKREALSWASRNPLFMTVRVAPPNSRTLAQLPE